MKPVSTKLIFAEVASEWHLDVFTHCLTGMECFNLQLQIGMGIVKVLTVLLLLSILLIDPVL